MELIEYISIVRRWWWLFVVAAIITGGIAFIVSRSQEPSYQGTVKIFTGGFLQDPNPGSVEIQAGTDLAQTYANLATVRPILEQTISALSLEITPEDLERKVSTRIVPNTSILVLTAQDTNPIRAAEIANEIANQLVVNSPTNLTPQQVSLREVIEAEISVISAQISEDRDELVDIRSQLEESNLSDTNRDLLQARQSFLIDQISQSQQAIADLSSSLNTLDTQTNRLTIVESALAPTQPVRTSILLMTFLGSIFGVILSGSIVLLIEYLDDSFVSPDEVRELTGKPVLGGIPEFGGKNDSYSDKLITLNMSGAGPSEGYRTLRTNLVYGFDPEQISRIVVTSSRQAEGKSITAANLAVALARADFKTVIIDLDLHRPKQHEIFGLENKIGISSLFNIPVNNMTKMSFEEIAELMLQPTNAPRLNVITSGPTPHSPSELIGLPHIPNLCNLLSDVFGVDMIIFDTPPTLVVADSIALASRTNASALIVVDAVGSRRQDVLKTVEYFQQIGVNILGTVLNKIRGDLSGYYYYYGYGSYEQQ